MVTGDLDGDGDDELVVLWYDRAAKRQSCAAVDNNLKVLWTRSDAHLMSRVVVRDLDGDGRAEVLATCEGQGVRTSPRPTDARLEVWDGATGKTRWQWQCRQVPEEAQVPRHLLQVHLAEDVDHDGRVEIVLTFDTGPRRKLWLVREGATTPHVEADMGLVPGTIVAGDVTG
ncbi:MAG: hypothetical protein KKI08_20600, partial [Armatimonadetes bacterium]|nr:hypothetical protein [Armatimonadota bacterium]